MFLKKKKNIIILINNVFKRRYFQCCYPLCSILPRFSNVIKSITKTIGFAMQTKLCVYHWGNIDFSSFSVLWKLPHIRQYFQNIKIDHSQRQQYCLWIMIPRVNFLGGSTNVFNCCSKSKCAYCFREQNSRFLLSSKYLGATLLIFWILKCSPPSIIF